MAESSLTAELTEIRRWLARFMGWDRTFGSWTATQITDGADMIDGGLRLFYQSYDWSFLKPTTTLTTVASQSSSTVTIASGVVTLASGTWPSWAASGDLIVDGNTYSVNTRDSSTQLTLDDLTVTAAAGTTYILARNTYTLPDGFGGFEGKLTYRPGTTNQRGALKRIDEGAMRERRQRCDITGSPEYYALRPVVLTASTGQRWEVLLDPLPDDVYVFDYRYRVLPDQITGSDVYSYGGQPHGQTIIAAVLAIADQTFNDGAKGKMADFQALLQQSIAHDRRQSPDFVGYNGDRSDGWDNEDGAELEAQLPATYAGYDV